MKKFYRNIDELVQNNDSPLDLSIFPNYMGINLVAVASIEWTRQEDGQLVDLKVNFMPHIEKEQQ